MLGPRLRALLKTLVPQRIRARLRRISEPFYFRYALGRLGLPSRLPFPDRRLLERIILPELVQQGHRRVLFVGCAWYTKDYGRICRNCDYHTIDVNPANERFGSKQQHVVGAMEDLRQWFNPEQFDLIVCNGVFGWGLNERANIEKAFNAAYECLRPGGVFLLGWTDRPEHVPVPVEGIEALRKFSPLTFELLGAQRYHTGDETHHVFAFFIKEPAAAISPSSASSGSVQPARQLPHFGVTTLVPAEIFTALATATQALGC